MGAFSGRMGYKKKGRQARTHQKVNLAGVKVVERDIRARRWGLLVGRVITILVILGYWDSPRLRGSIRRSLPL
jgi:hypothetical protein